MDLLTLPGVFAPISDSWMLSRAIEEEQPLHGRRVLDLCTGSGIQAVTAARLGADATAVDVCRRALATVKLNARRNGTRVRVRRGHLFDAVPGERFDLVVSNPPYVPSRDALPTAGPSRAWAASADGRRFLDEICDRAPGHLEPGGVLLVVHSSLIGEDRTLERLRRAGFVEVTVAQREHGPLGPLMREQQEAGTIPADVDDEDVIVVRAVLPG